jgi:Trypsin
MRPIRPALLSLVVSAGCVLTGSILAGPAGAIIGGQTVARGTLTSAAEVVAGDRLCSGALITPRIILLALHCRAGRRAKVRIGNPDRGGRVQIRRGVKSFTAPQLDPPPGVIGYTDIEALALDRAASPAPLQVVPTVDSSELTAAGTTLLVAGFGEHYPLQPLDPARLPLREASILVSQCVGLVAGADGSPFAGCAKPAPAAAAYARPGNPCAGDSGSPVIGFSPTLSKLVLVGVLSGGVGTECGWLTPSVFTPIGPILTWLSGLTTAKLPSPARQPSGCHSDRRRLASLRRSIDALSRRLSHHRLDRALAGELRQLREALHRIADIVYERC